MSDGRSDFEDFEDAVLINRPEVKATHCIIPPAVITTMKAITIDPQEARRQHLQLIVDQCTYQEMKPKLEGVCRNCHPDKLSDSELCCLFCYCPSYNLDGCEGMNKGLGKWLEKVNQHTGRRQRIKDCSGCYLPHVKENVVRMLDIMYFTYEAAHIGKQFLGRTGYDEPYR